MKKFHANIKCDCGHTKRYHYLGEGCCDGSRKTCGCTLFWPNTKYILSKNKQSKNRIIPR